MLSKEELGRKIRSERKRKGLTPTQIETYYGIKRATLMGWENGKYYPSIEAVQTLCELFDYDVDVFLNAPYSEDAPKHREFADVHQITKLSDESIGILKNADVFIVGLLNVLLRYGEIFEYAREYAMHEWIYKDNKNLIDLAYPVFEEVYLNYGNGILLISHGEDAFCEFESVLEEKGIVSGMFAEDDADKLFHQCMAKKMQPVLKSAINDVLTKVLQEYANDYEALELKWRDSIPEDSGFMKALREIEKEGDGNGEGK